jgi:hypothetical protein
MKIETLRGNGWQQLGKWLKIKKQGDRGDICLQSHYPASDSRVFIILPAEELKYLIKFVEGSYATEEEAINGQTNQGAVDSGRDAAAPSGRPGAIGGSPFTKNRGARKAS